MIQKTEELLQQLDKRHLKIAFLGHPGSYTEEATLKFVDNLRLDALKIPCVDANEVMEHVMSSGSNCIGILPVNNTLAGPVKDTLNTLGDNADMVRKLDDVTLVIHHCLASQSRVKPSSIKHVFSHQQALSQCSEYIDSHLKRAKIHPYSSTSTAARDLVENKLPANSAVIASERAITIFGLTKLADHIENKGQNVTTFIVFSKLY